MNFITEEMGITSLQACMDSSDHRSRSLQAMISDDNAGIMGNSTHVAAPNDGGDGDGDGDILACSRPLIERRLRPNHEQALKCPRCESTHTKFCYYNNYSLTQPRYFCKTCRRYWTKGGTLRNIPVGGGCRKNKKVSSASKKPSSSSSDQTTVHRPSPSFSSPLTLDHTAFLPRNHHLAFPDQLQFSSLHSAGLLFDNSNLNPVEYMQNPNDNFCGNQFGFIPPFENGVVGPTNYLPYDHENHQTHYQMMDQNHHHHQAHYHHNHEADDVKPNAAKILSLEWHDCNSDAGIKDSFGYGLGSWAGLMGGYGSSAANPLV